MSENQWADRAEHLCQDGLMLPEEQFPPMPMSQETHFFYLKAWTQQARVKTAEAPLSSPTRGGTEGRKVSSTPMAALGKAFSPEPPPLCWASDSSTSL